MSRRHRGDDDSSSAYDSDAGSDGYSDSGSYSTDSSYSGGSSDYYSDDGTSSTLGESGYASDSYTASTDDDYSSSRSTDGSSSMYYSGSSGGGDGSSYSESYSATPSSSYYGSYSLSGSSGGHSSHHGKHHHGESRHRSDRHRGRHHHGSSSKRSRSGSRRHRHRSERSGRRHRDEESYTGDNDEDASYTDQGQGRHHHHHRRSSSGGGTSAANAGVPEGLHWVKTTSESVREFTQEIVTAVVTFMRHAVQYALKRRTAAEAAKGITQGGANTDTAASAAGADGNLTPQQKLREQQQEQEHKALLMLREAQIDVLKHLFQLLAKLDVNGGPANFEGVSTGTLRGELSAVLANTRAGTCFMPALQRVAAQLYSTSESPMHIPDDVAVGDNGSRDLLRYTASMDGSLRHAPAIHLVSFIEFVIAIIVRGTHIGAALDLISRGGLYAQQQRGRHASQQPIVAQHMMQQMQQRVDLGMFTNLSHFESVVTSACTRSLELFAKMYTYTVPEEPKRHEIFGASYFYGAQVQSQMGMKDVKDDIKHKMRRVVSRMNDTFKSQTRRLAKHIRHSNHLSRKALRRADDPERHLSPPPPGQDWYHPAAGYDYDYYYGDGGGRYGRRGRRSSGSSSRHGRRGRSDLYPSYNAHYYGGVSAGAPPYQYGNAPLLPHVPASSGGGYGYNNNGSYYANGGYDTNYGQQQQQYGWNGQQQQPQQAPSQSQQWSYNNGYGGGYNGYGYSGGHGQQQEYYYGGGPPPPPAPPRRQYNRRRPPANNNGPPLPQGNYGYYGPPPPQQHQQNNGYPMPTQPPVTQNSNNYTYGDYYPR